MPEDRAWSPREITPAVAGVEASPEALLKYLTCVSDLRGLLTSEKALVFRGFQVSGQTLEPVLDLLLPSRLPYVHGNSPRSKVGRNIYTSTEYPPEFTISMHNELSYAAQWPSRLLFFCERAPAAGGATPVVDGAAWLESLDPEVRAAFCGGVRYTQNLHDGYGLGRSWQNTFETDDRAAVEAYLAGTGATWQWTSDGLRVRQVRPATIIYPSTGAEVWFNQADQWHPAMLGDEASAVLSDIMTEDDMPQSVTFAEGSPIPADYVAHVRDQGLAAAIDVDWHAGDLMLIDNVLVAHGRRPFSGRRRVLVAMSD